MDPARRLQGERPAHLGDEARLLPSSPVGRRRDARKSKKGKAPVDVPKAQDDTTSTTSPPSPGFIAKEYAALKEAGIEEEEEIENIIIMRWKKMQALKAATEPEVDVEEVEEAEVEEAEDNPSAFIKIPLKLTADQAATSKYVFVSGPDDENNYLYRKLSDDTPAASAAKTVAPVLKAPAPKPKLVASAPKATSGKMASAKNFAS
eukprot:7379746-Prymnesium_polylepis.1